MNLAGLSSLANFNQTRRFGTGGFLAQSGGGGGSAGGNPSFDYSAATYGSGLLPGGYLRASPSNTGQARKIYGVDFPVVGFPDTGWDPNQRLDQYQGSIPGVGMPLRGEIGGGPPTGGPGFSSELTPFDPLSYGANPPPNEDVSPTPVNTFLSNYNPNVGTAPRRPLSGGYPDLSNLPPVSVSAPYGTASNPYPIPGYGGLPSNYGGGQSWQSNAARGGGFAGLASAAAAGAGFGGGLTSRGGGGWQGVSELPSGLGSMSWLQAFGGRGPHIL